MKENQIPKNMPKICMKKGVSDEGPRLKEDILHRRGQLKP
jgi:hypothetical protein